MSNIKVDEIAGGISTTFTYTTFLDGAIIPSNKSFNLSGTGTLSTIGIVTAAVLIGDGSNLRNLPVSREGQIAAISIIGIL